MTAQEEIWLLKVAANYCEAEFSTAQEEIEQLNKVIESKNVIIDGFATDAICASVELNLHKRALGQLATAMFVNYPQDFRDGVDRTLGAEKFKEKLISAALEAARKEQKDEG